MIYKGKKYTAKTDYGLRHFGGEARLNFEEGFP